MHIDNEYQGILFTTVKTHGEVLEFFLVTPRGRIIFFQSNFLADGCMDQLMQSSMGWFNLLFDENH